MGRLSKKAGASVGLGNCQLAGYISRVYGKPSHRGKHDNGHINACIWVQMAML